MPLCPSEAFLLWHEAARAGRWRELLRREATADVLLALWLMQTYTLHPLKEDEGRRESIAARAAAALASGWGQ